MNMHALGATRSRRGIDHFLQTPNSFVYAPLPGMRSCTAVVHAAPALGASFTQYTAAFQGGGVLGEALGSRFLYVLEGTVELLRSGTEAVSLSADSFACVAAGEPHQVRAIDAARVAVIEKPYVPLSGIDAPQFLHSSADSVESTALLGDEALQVKALLPDDPAFDFAVNLMEYQPGARLSMVESHVMEHGLLMLDGEGIYRLGDAWYPVAKGDFIWMAPFCPQWFGALGSRSARYLIYKDWNRHPLAAGGRS